MMNQLSRRAILWGIPALVAATSVAAGLFSPAVQDNLDLALRRSTDTHLYTVEITPVEAAIRLGRMHAWTVAVVDATGAPVEAAEIAVDGGMPGHGHGLPTAPAVTRALGEGRFLIEGMKFNMPGWWEIELHIDGRAGADTITFNLVL